MSTLFSGACSHFLFVQLGEQGARPTVLKPFEISQEASGQSPQNSIGLSHAQQRFRRFQEDSGCEKESAGLQGLGCICFFTNCQPQYLYQLFDRQVKLLFKVKTFKQSHSTAYQPDRETELNSTPLFRGSLGQKCLQHFFAAHVNPVLELSRAKEQFQLHLHAFVKT